MTRHDTSGNAIPAAMLSAPTIPVTPPDLHDKDVNDGSSATCIRPRLLCTVMSALTSPATPPDLHDEAAMTEHDMLEEFAEMMPNPTIPVAMTPPDLHITLPDLHAEAAMIAHQMLEEFANELPNPTIPDRAA